MIRSALALLAYVVAALVILGAAGAGVALPP